MYISNSIALNHYGSESLILVSKVWIYAVFDTCKLCSCLRVLLSQECEKAKECGPTNQADMCMTGNGRQGSVLMCPPGWRLCTAQKQVPKLTVLFESVLPEFCVGAIWKRTIHTKHRIDSTGLCCRKNNALFRLWWILVILVGLGWLWQSDNCYKGRTALVSWFVVNYCITIDRL